MHPLFEIQQKLFGWLFPTGRYTKSDYSNNMRTYCFRKVPARWTKAVGVDKSTDCGVVISCLEIVQSRFVVVVVTAIAERVCGAHLEPTVGRVIHLKNVAPSVVYIFDKTTERRVRSAVIRAPDFNYIALKILLVIIIVTEVVHSGGATRCVIEEIRGIALLCTGKHRV